MKDLDKFGNFRSEDGRVFLVKCPSPECGMENYAMNVASGICTFCGLDGNKYYAEIN